MKDRVALKLLDELGKPRVNLGMTTDGPALLLTDEVGEIRVDLSTASKGPALLLMDEAGEMRAGIGQTDLVMFDIKGEAIWNSPR